MPYCPACGHHVAPGDATCSECGESIADALAAGRSTPGSRSPPDGRGDGERDSGRDRPTDRGDPSDAETPEAMATAQADPHTRRRVLAAAGGVLGTMVLGTYAIDRVAGGGPTDAVGAWRTAWVTGDAETFRRLWHPSATQPDAGAADALGRPSEANAALEYIGEERAVLERAETRASVSDVFVLGHPDFETRRRHETVVDLRTVDGNWRVVRERLERTEPTSCRRTITITGPGRLVCE